MGGGVNQSILNFFGILFTACVTLVVAAMNLHQTRRLNDVHMLVNSRLDKALKTIEELRQEIQFLRERQ